MFILNETVLKRLFGLNSFSVPQDPMIFFGLRGCSPVDLDDLTWSDRHYLQVNNINYLNPRCTLGQWMPGKGIAVFPGSTVPYQGLVSEAKKKGGIGANQLMTGFYSDYRKGVHNSDSATGHQAFRQANKLPIRRTKDDLDYDTDDRIEYMAPFDNLHCAWSMGLSDRYSSAGCQVVAGYPKCEKRNGKPDTGPWKTFRENAYSISQTSFFYMLLEGRDAQKVATVQSPSQLRLRYGSQGQWVTKLQEGLKAKGFYEGNIDDQFGYRTLMATLNFQRANFDRGGDDGIVGPMTAEALSLNLPKI